MSGKMLHWIDQCFHGLLDRPKKDQVYLLLLVTRSNNTESTYVAKHVCVTCKDSLIKTCPKKLYPSQFNNQAQPQFGSCDCLQRLPVTLAVYWQYVQHLFSMLAQPVLSTAVHLQGFSNVARGWPSKTGIHTLKSYRIKTDTECGCSSFSLLSTMVCFRVYIHRNPFNAHYQCVVLLRTNLSTCLSVGMHASYHCNMSNSCSAHYECLWSQSSASKHCVQYTLNPKAASLGAFHPCTHVCCCLVSAHSSQ